MELHLSQIYKIKYIIISNIFILKNVVNFVDSAMYNIKCLEY